MFAEPNCFNSDANAKVCQDRFVSLQTFKWYIAALLFVYFYRTHFLISFAGLIIKQNP